LPWSRPLRFVHQHRLNRSMKSFCARPLKQGALSKLFSRPQCLQRRANISLPCDAQRSVVQKPAHYLLKNSSFHCDCGKCSTMRVRRPLNTLRRTNVSSRRLRRCGAKFLGWITTGAGHIRLPQTSHRWNFCRKGRCTKWPPNANDVTPRTPRKAERNLGPRSLSSLPQLSPPEVGSSCS
jgi:hypothetical protein